MACVVSDYSVHSARVLTRLILHIEARPNAPVLYVVANSARAPLRARVDAREFTKAIAHPIALEIPYDGKPPSLAEDLGEPLEKHSAMAKGVARLARIMTGDSSQNAGAGLKVVRWLRRAA
jgi:Flp pilus assembly CpaE family ATPase